MTQTALPPIASREVDDRLIALARRFGMPICDQLPDLEWPAAWTDKITYSFCQRHRLLPVRQEREVVLAVVADPLEMAGLDELRLLLGTDVTPLYCPEEVLSAGLQRAFGDQGKSASGLLADIQKESVAAGEETTIYDLLDPAPSAPIVRLLNAILKEAINQGASDIHFEPLEGEMRVRYRIDGVLQIRHAPPREKQAQLLTRLKVMAGLDIAEHRLPQDGRIRLMMGGRQIDFRVSTVPVTAGERIVLRILDRGNVILGLDRMGIPLGTLEALRRLIRLPEGILLVTGPTGSGKTTTLYSTLSELNAEDVNIMTVEDPVEYKLAGIAQIGVRPNIGLRFADALRHILRQDPDVIMVGEIRDPETAEIAVQASLTGHLVFSTLHTNDAPSALTRLADMGVEPYLLSSSVIGVVAQRLVRAVCSYCSVQSPPSEAELAEVLDLPPYLWRGKGCEFCFGSGYRGRHGIFELMRMTPALRQQVVISPDATRLRQLALESAMQPLARCGMELVRAGKTTLSEVLRVTRGIEQE
jgi:general secretion pathway protein E